MKLTWRGEALELRPERVLHWPRERTLFLADLHLGKAALFRDRGLVVPDGAEAEDLARLRRVVRVTGSQRVVVLGDLVHGAGGWTPEVVEAFAALGTGQRGTPAQGEVERLRVWLVPGNHDRPDGPPPHELGIEQVEEGVRLGPFRLRHADDETGDGVICGHEHPVVVLRGRGDRLRMPCFVVDERRLLLPAFGSFTGGQRVRRSDGRRIFGVGQGSVVAI